ncbi:MAG: reverse transcriptase family protein [Planctomycetota bacterium]
MERLLDWFSNKRTPDELARRLGIDSSDLQKVDSAYCSFEIAKKSGGKRKIHSPNSELKKVQRLILRRLLGKLKTHQCATAFKSGVSFVDNARCHQCQDVVVNFDLVGFFESIPETVVKQYFFQIGWNRQAARLLAKLTTHNGCLPQGAPTSPAISNLVNYLLDVRLFKIAERYDAVYTRYADDITISSSMKFLYVHELIRDILLVVRSSGYEPHIKKKFDVRRQHQCQEVTGLVVNERANLSRKKRRWLRAVEHRFKTPAGPRPTITKEQFEGWRALVKSINADRPNC